MHIKQVIIEGFRTYKARTVIDDVHPGVNVILGKNGHGKSNIFDGSIHLLFEMLGFQKWILWMLFHVALSCLFPQCSEHLILVLFFPIA